LFSNKGQGTTEYIIILAVIIVIALIVVGVMGWMPGLSTGITEQQSRAYWQSTAPISLTDWKIDTAGSSFTFRNMSSDKITVQDMNIDGVTVGLTDTPSIAAGGSKTVTATHTCSGVGEAYQYDVNIGYDVSKGISGKKVIGLKPLVGICQ